MWLPKEVHKKLTAEFKFAVEKMMEAEEPIRKLFFFSAMFSEVSRQLNWHWDQNLVLMHMVMQDAHTHLTNRIQQLGPGKTTELVMNTLTEVASDLAKYVEKNGEGMDLCDILGRIAVANYAATPHGTYITEKGLLKLPNAT